MGSTRQKPDVTFWEGFWAIVMMLLIAFLISKAFIPTITGIYKFIFTNQ